MFGFIAGPTLQLVVSARHTCPLHFGEPPPPLLQESFQKSPLLQDNQYARVGLTLGVTSHGIHRMLRACFWSTDWKAVIIDVITSMHILSPLHMHLMSTTP